MKKILVFLIISIALLAASSPILAANGFGITLPNPLCPQGPWTGVGPPDPNRPCINDFPTLISKITTFVVTVVTSISVVIFLYAGFLYLTSAGSPERIAKGNKAVIYAIVGIAIALAGTGLVEVITAVVGTGP